MKTSHFFVLWLLLIFSSIIYAQSENKYQLKKSKSLDILQKEYEESKKRVSTEKKQNPQSRYLLQDYKNQFKRSSSFEILENAQREYERREMLSKMPWYPKPITPEEKERNEEKERLHEIEVAKEPKHHCSRMLNLKKEEFKDVDNEKLKNYFEGEKIKDIHIEIAYYSGLYYFRVTDKELSRFWEN